MIYVIFIENHLHVLMIQVLTMVFSTVHASLKISYTIVVTLTLMNKKKSYSEILFLSNLSLNLSREVYDPPNIDMLVDSKQQTDEYFPS